MSKRSIALDSLCWAPRRAPPGYSFRHRRLVGGGWTRGPRMLHHFGRSRGALEWSRTGGRCMRELPVEVEALRKIPFFDELTPEDLDRIAKIGERPSFAPG